MHFYTSVVFDALDRRMFGRVAAHLRIAFPDMHTQMPKNKRDRIPDHDARIITQLRDDPTIGTYENVHQALRVIDTLAVVLTRESRPEHWLSVFEKEAGRPIPRSDEPTSNWQQAIRSAQARGSQLRDATAALELLSQAAAVVSPRDPDEAATDAAATKDPDDADVDDGSAGDAVNASAGSSA
jgi:hypothetical protein